MRDIETGVVIRGPFGPNVIYLNKSRDSFVKCKECLRMVEKTFMHLYDRRSVCKWCMERITRTGDRKW